MQLMRCAPVGEPYEHSPSQQGGYRQLGTILQSLQTQPS